VVEATYLCLLFGPYFDGRDVDMVFGSTFILTEGGRVGGRKDCVHSCTRESETGKKRRREEAGRSSSLLLASLLVYRLFVVCLFIPEHVRDM
jgi:hypothetical protein